MNESLFLNIIVLFTLPSPVIFFLVCFYFTLPEANLFLQATHGRIMRTGIYRKR